MLTADSNKRYKNNIPIILVLCMIFNKLFYYWMCYSLMNKVLISNNYWLFIEY